MPVDETTDEFRSAVAYHEAGHAVLHCIFDHPIDYATIEPGEGTCGHVIGDSGYRNLWEYQFDASDSAWKDRQTVERSIMVLMAGEIAQRRYELTSVKPEHGNCDRENINTLLELLAGGAHDQELLTAWHTLLDIRTQRLVDDLWNYIQAVADALIAKQTLTGQEVYDICRWTRTCSQLAPTLDNPLLLYT